MIEVRAATDPGPPAGRPNEDWVTSTPCAVVVLDGVTTRGRTGCQHSVPWYVRQLGGRLATRISDPGAELVDALADAIGDVAAMHADTCDLAAPGTPAAAVGCVRWRGGRVECLVLADVVLAAALPGGVRVVSDTRVSASEPASRHRVGTAAHARSVERMMLDQLAVRNRPGGYWVAAADPGAAGEAVTANWPAGDVDQVAVLTDGAAALVDRYGLASCPVVLDVLASAGPAEIIRRVRAAEASDPDASRWPRAKSGDDATAAMVRARPRGRQGKGEHRRGAAPGRAT